MYVIMRGTEYVAQSTAKRHPYTPCLQEALLFSSEAGAKAFGVYDNETIHYIGPWR